MGEIKLSDLVKKIEKIKSKMAKDRDFLRDIQDEINDLMENYDKGIESLRVAKEEFESAVDTFSEFV